MPPRKRADTPPAEAQPPVAHDTLAAALAAFQAEMPVVGKNKTANVPMKSGGSYSYRYADLADVTAAATPLLVRHGLAFTCLPRAAESGRGYELAGVLLHTTSTERLEGALPLVGNAAQELGSAITYARRYLLGCMTGLVTDDDDDAQAANHASAARAWDGPSTRQLLTAIEKDAVRAGADLDIATAKFRTQHGIPDVDGLYALDPWALTDLAAAVHAHADKTVAEREAAAAAAEKAPDGGPAATWHGPTTKELLDMIDAHAQRAGVTYEEITAKWRGENGALTVDDLDKLAPWQLAPLEAQIADYLLAHPPGAPA